MIVCPVCGIVPDEHLIYGVTTCPCHRTQWTSNLVCFRLEDDRTHLQIKDGVLEVSVMVASGRWKLDPVPVREAMRRMGEAVRLGICERVLEA